MLAQTEGVTKILLSILLFPVFFQMDLIHFGLGTEDIFWIGVFKKFFLLLPILGIIFACWLTIPCLLTVIFRHKRQHYLSAILVTWWDLFRSIFTFWGGIFKFFFFLAGAILGALRLCAIGLWLIIQDIILSPLRLAKDVGNDYFKPGVPWLAVMMTFCWAFIEALLFTFIMTEMVIEILSGISGVDISPLAVKPLLFLFVLFLVLGSYALLSTFGEAIRKKQISKIIQVGAFEVFALVFEVVFLYREFVDALAPWFKQRGDIELGIFGILAIAGFAWLGIRGLTWFLFAESGTPVILAVIQRSGLKASDGTITAPLNKDNDNLAYIRNAIEKVKNDLDWFRDKGDEIISSLILPPLQIIGAMINFCTLLITSNHLFELPFASFKDLLSAKNLIEKTKEKQTEE